MAVLLAGALLLHGIVCGRVLDRRLSTATWVTASPKTALLLWQALAVGTFASLLGATLLLAHDVLEHVLLVLLGVDKGQLHLAYAGEREIPSAWNLTVAVALVIVVATVVSVVWSWHRSERFRTPHRLVDGTVMSDDGMVTVLEVAGEGTFAFCLPRRRLPSKPARIFVSRAAREHLSRAELAAVIGHERAHLEGRHHLLVTLAAATSTVTARIGLLPGWGGQTSRLIELIADDRAARDHGRTTVARALLAMSTSPTPMTLLGAGDGDMGERIRRLIPATAVESRTGVTISRVRGVAAAVTVVVLPLTGVFLPGLTVFLDAPM